jgi:hypothetical protein
LILSTIKIRNKIKYAAFIGRTLKSFEKTAVKDKLK